MREALGGSLAFIGFKESWRLSNVQVQLSPQEGSRAHSLVFASTESGPWRFPPWSPNSRNLYLRAGSRPETVTSRSSVLTGTDLG